MKNRKIPRFYGFRIYAASTAIYMMLVFPSLFIVLAQNMPKMEKISSVLDEVSVPADSTDIQRAAKPGNNDTTLRINPFTLELDTIENIRDSISGRPVKIQRKVDTADQESLLGKAINLFFLLLTISFVLGWAFNYPFKRYVRRKRKNKKISPALFRFCKKFLLKVPLINTAILLITYGISNANMFFYIQQPDQFENEFMFLIYRQFFYVSFIASIMALLFVYFWSKHRVHLKHLHFFFSEIELKRRIFREKAGKIGTRLWISSAMTTLLPLIIVIIYLYRSSTSLADIGLTMATLTDDQTKILFGEYARFSWISDIFGDMDAADLTYVNLTDKFLMFAGIYAGIFVSLLYILFFVKWTTDDIVYPVKELLANMQRTGEGDLSSFSVVRTNDEIGELTEGYNDMAQKLRDYIANISRMNEAYYRFVPRQFLEFLGKDNIVDIKLGDQVQKEMSVLFTDIRSFTSLSEQMTPAENFNFINNYLGLMEPVITHHGGFIDKFIGDSIMALFPGKVEDALNAAVEMKRTLNDYNLIREAEGRQPIITGIGIHTGNLMLGVVGGIGRMEGTVISDAVNLASRLEGLTKLYGTSIIISQDTLIKLEKPTEYSYRFLDVVKVRGKKESVYIFEILDGLTDRAKELRISTRQAFGDGLDAYKAKEFQKAKSIFESILEKNPNDQAVQLYVSRCSENMRNGIPDNWDGVEVINTK